jgi:integrase
LHSALSYRSPEEFEQQTEAGRSADSKWFQGSARIVTYELEESLATKRRALYQRRKGRDLFDLAVALETGKWVIADLIGKGEHIRTVPVPAWPKRVLDDWLDSASIATGAFFRRVGGLGKIWAASLTPKAIWHIVKAAAKRGGIWNLAPHDLRRTCARLCHLARGELEQIQFLLGHAFVQTTEHYLGCKQKLRNAVNDNPGPEDV